MLFGDELLQRPRRDLVPGAIWVPGWLSPPQQAWIMSQVRQWANGPVPLRAATVRGHQMSVKTLCLGWHWRPYQYTREAVDVNGRRVLPFPDWMARLGRRALFDATGDERAAGSYCPDTALVNYYDDTARMGMHQDKDERSLAPVVSLSIGNTARFRFGNTRNRNRPYQDIDLESGDLIVFGGESRLAFHGILEISPHTAPVECGLTGGRINITMRVTGLADPI